MVSEGLHCSDHDPAVDRLRRLDQVSQTFDDLPFHQQPHRGPRDEVFPGFTKQHLPANTSGEALCIRRPAPNHLHMKPLSR
jgi:hypothetical protein